MFRKMLPLAVAIVLVMGCGKKKDEEGGGGGGGGSGDGTTNSDPNATFTLKFRDEQAGDKTTEIDNESGTSDVSFAGKSEKMKENKKIEYTENIIEMPDGGGKPTKLTRAYKTAQKSDKAGNLKALPYEGKTVNIEKKGGVYEFTIDGKKMAPQDSSELAREFSKPDKSKNQDLLPKKPVKVGESWDIDMAAMKSLAGDMPFPLDTNKSKMTGKLTRAYTKDGKQWGTIAVDFDLRIDSSVAGGGKKGPGGSLNGNVKMTGTLDAVVDGSARDGTFKMNIKMELSGQEGGGELKMTADMVAEKTIKTVK